MTFVLHQRCHILTFILIIRHMHILLQPGVWTIQHQVRYVTISRQFFSKLHFKMTFKRNSGTGNSGGFIRIGGGGLPPLPPGIVSAASSTADEMGMGNNTNASGGAMTSAGGPFPPGIYRELNLVRRIQKWESRPFFWYLTNLTKFVFSRFWKNFEWSQIRLGNLQNCFLWYTKCFNFFNVHQGWRRHCRYRKRLEVCSHGSRQALPHHVHLLHNRGDCRSPILCTSHHRHLKSLKTSYCLGLFIELRSEPRLQQHAQPEDFKWIKYFTQLQKEIEKCWLALRVQLFL